MSAAVNLTEEERIKHEQYINTINAEIDKKTKEKEKYERVQTKASTITSLMEELERNSHGIDSLLENLVIGGMPLDNGAFEQIGKNIGSMIGIFSSIISKCAQNINKLQSEIDDLASKRW